MTLLRGRTVKLAIGEADLEFTNFDIVEGGAVLRPGIRIEFDIERTLAVEPNTARIHAYNLNADSRHKVENLGTQFVTLCAGYGPEPPQLFQGDMRRVHSERQGPDIVTIFEVGDAEVAFRTARINQGWSPGTIFKRIFRDLVKEAKINGKIAVQQMLKGNFQAAEDAFVKGWTASGRTIDELTRLAVSKGLEISVQDGELQVLEQNQPTNDPAIVLNKDTGLLGEASITSEGWVACAALLVPDLRPGRQILVQSGRARQATGRGSSVIETTPEGLQINGFFRAERCRYIGDSRGNQWTIEIEGRPL